MSANGNYGNNARQWNASPWTSQPSHATSPAQRLAGTLFLLLLTFSAAWAGPAATAATPAASSNTTNSVSPTLQEAFKQLDELLKKPDKEIDVGKAAMIMGKVVDPSVDIEKSLTRLKELADSFPSDVDSIFNTEHRVEAFMKHLFKTRGYGNLGALEPDEMPSGIAGRRWLHRVLENKLGNCTALSTLAVALGNRRGLPIRAVVLPGHVFVRVEDSSGRYNLETTAAALVPDADYRANFTIGSCKAYMRQLTAREFIGALLSSHLGYELSQKGDRNPDALACFDRALELFPDFPETLVNRGATLRQMGRIQDALASYAKAIELDPQHASTWYNRGNALLDEKKYEEALQSYARAVELNPYHVQAWSQKAFALEHLGRDKEALDCVRQVEKVKAGMRGAGIPPGAGQMITGTDDSGRTLLLSRASGGDVGKAGAYDIGTKATLFGNIGRHKEALALYDTALREMPKDKVLWFNKGNSQAALGKDAEALESYDKALQIDPEYVSALGGKAYLLQQLGRTDEALALLEKAEKIDKEDQRIWGIKARLLASSGKAQDALTMLDKARFRGRRDLGTWFTKAQILTELGQHEQALICYDEILELVPEEPSVLASKAHSLNELERYKEAIECANLALRTIKDFPPALAVKTGALCSLKRYDEADRIVDVLIKTHPDEYQYEMKAYVASKQEKYKSAVEYYNKVIELAPGAPDGYNGLAWIRATCPKDEFRDARKAVDLASKAAALSKKKTFGVLSTVACAHAEAGDFEKALSILKEATPLASDKEERTLDADLLKLFAGKKPYRDVPIKEK
ncbi:MAG: hypothetical protein C0404_03785 [Verrucomicrobia bacterium]|nr:hypothetical protein [Verrucomicrobiota bacterium]